MSSAKTPIRVRPRILGTTTQAKRPAFSERLLRATYNLSHKRPVSSERHLRATYHLRHRLLRSVRLRRSRPCQIMTTQQNRKVHPSASVRRKILFKTHPPWDSTIILKAHPPPDSNSGRLRQRLRITTRPTGRDQQAHSEPGSRLNFQQLQLLPSQLKAISVKSQSSALANRPLRHLLPAVPLLSRLLNQPHLSHPAKLQNDL